MILLPILASRGQPMNLTRIALASVAAFFAYFAVGGLVFGLLPWMRNEYLKYPNVYRSQEGIKSTMPIGMAFMFLAIVEHACPRDRESSICPCRPELSRRLAA
jgi:hypothetical protein